MKNNKSFIYFLLVTTQEDPKPTPVKMVKSRKASAGVVVPSVLGVMACLGIVGFIVVRKMRNRNADGILLDDH